MSPISLDRWTPPFPLDEAKRACLDAPSLEALRASRFHRVHGPALGAYLGRVWTGPGPTRGDPGAGAPARERLRIVSWNIEQAKRWDRLRIALLTDPFLASADLWMLQEIDIGMARSGNRDVVGEIASLLGFHWCFTPTFLELSKGPGADALAPGENLLGLHGIALLSRWPLEECAAADLPDCFDYFRFQPERRCGRRKVLWARVLHPRAPFWLATAHLEVRNSPDCRARQMGAACDALPPGPCWLGGDWNTHTFRRGGILTSAAGFLRLQRTPVATMARELLAPWDREPLFSRIERAGFDYRRWNEQAPTAHERLGRIEELDRLPAPLRGTLSRRFGLDDRLLEMRLDWIACRGDWRPPDPGEPASWTGVPWGPAGSGASDHAPIGVTASTGPGPAP